MPRQGEPPSVEFNSRAILSLIDPHHWNSPALLETIRKTGIRGDGPGVVIQRVEKSSWLEAGEVEGKDDVLRGSPANLEISLIAEIAGAAGSGWINQHSASESVYSVVRGFPPVPVPGEGARNVRLQLELNDWMQIDQVLGPEYGRRLGGKICATGEKRVEGAESLIRRIAVAALHVRP
jgi:hypothetical protein